MRNCEKNIEYFESCISEIFECELCGNHVCRQCFSDCRGVCPNCFGRLLRIS